MQSSISWSETADEDHNCGCTRSRMRRLLRSRIPRLASHHRLHKGNLTTLRKGFSVATVRQPGAALRLLPGSNFSTTTNADSSTVTSSRFTTITYWSITIDFGRHQPVGHRFLLAFCSYYRYKFINISFRSIGDTFISTPTMVSLSPFTSAMSPAD